MGNQAWPSHYQNGDIRFSSIQKYCQNTKCNQNITTHATLAYHWTNLITNVQQHRSKIRLRSRFRNNTLIVEKYRGIRLTCHVNEVVQRHYVNIAWYIHSWWRELWLNMSYSAVFFDVGAWYGNCTVMCHPLYVPVFGMMQ